LILVDTSRLVAFYDDLDSLHGETVRVLQDPQARILSPFVLAELDDLVLSNVGRRVELEVLDDIGGGAYELAPFVAADVADAVDVVRRYSDFDVGLTDASIVVLSRRYGVNDVLTLDERHFRVLRGSRDRPFRVLPADA
jgi:uncharacterized protein